MIMHKNKVAVVGYSVPVKCGRYPNTTDNELALEAIKAAVENTGIALKDIQGLFKTPGTFSLSPLAFSLQLSQVCEYLRISPKSMAEISCAGVAGGLAIKHAMNEIALGYIDLAVVYAAEREHTGIVEYATSGLLTREKIEGLSFYEPISTQPFVPLSVIPLYAMSGRRYMHEYGATEEHFAMAMVRNRKGAMHNPWAAFTNPITVEDVLNSRKLYPPIKLLDSSAALDGAAAIVLASEEKAKKITDTPVYISSVGEYHDNSNCIPTDGCDKSLTSFIAVRRSAEDALKRANVKLRDINVAEVYAPFSPHELMIPEDIGFFKKGEMMQAIQDGLTEIGGKIPINTDGGLTSRGHPAMVTPLYEMISIIRQLRNEAGKIQVPKAEVGLMHCEGGVVNNCMVFIFKRGD